MGWSATNITWCRLVFLCLSNTSQQVCLCEQEEQSGVEIASGDEVYVEQNGKMLSGKVMEVSSQTQYEVSFEDGSVCSNLNPGDIVVSGVGELLYLLLFFLSLSQDPPSTPPQQGSKLRVRWSDGQIYSTTVLGQHSAPLYTVSGLL